MLSRFQKVLFTPIVIGGDIMKKQNTPEYRVDFQVRNNLILQRMEERGIASVAELCRKIGASQSEMGEILGFKKSPLCKVSPKDSEPTEWRTIVIKMADFFKCDPGDLFPEQMRLLEDNKRSVAVYADQMYALAQMNEQEGMINLLTASDPEEECVRLQLEKVTKDLLNTLTDRERRVLELRFRQEKSLEEIARMYDASSERIRQIEAKALRKLRCPTRAGRLESFLD